jgi:hypothetical protein
MAVVRVRVVLHGHLAGPEAVELGESVERVYDVDRGAPFDDLVRLLQAGRAGDLILVTKVLYLS